VNASNGRCEKQRELMNFVEKFLVQESLGRPRRRWKDNFTINAFENGIRGR